ncbi:MAG: TRAP transporter small permease, partial [Planctomycetes bacterium]|nr:TRAP transporter small permease [Planctomycetota bacterium]
VWRQVFDRQLQFFNGVAWVFFVLMIAVMLLQVFTRYVINKPIAWTEETSRFSYIWAIFLGAIIAQREKAHMTVTILVDKLPGRLRRAQQVFADCFSMAVLGVVLYGTILQMRRSYGILASTIDISYTYIYLPLAIGAGSMILLLVGSLVRNLRAIVTGDARGGQQS